MQVFKRKTRMVSFRLSEDEYQILRRASESQSARSVSDFARDSLFHMLQDATRTADAHALELRIEELASEFKALTGDLENLRAFVGQNIDTKKEVPCISTAS
jgi:uncharacterized protein (DUF1778 family)